MPNLIIPKLTRLLGQENVLTDEASKLAYGKDLTQNYTPNPLAIVFPRDQQDVIEIVKLANHTKTVLVPSGGRTGYSGGAVAKSREVIVSFEKMNKIVSFNKGDRQITCEAGVTTKAIQRFAAKHRLFYPIDYAAVDKCHIAGNVATNAGGIHVIRYGSTRRWVVGLKVITGNGDLLELNYGLIKNSSGYDFRHLFIGSEGTLGLITEVTLQLTDPPKRNNTIFLAIPNKKHFIDILNIFRKSVQVAAFEFFDNISIEYVKSYTNIEFPFEKESPYYALLDYESSPESDKLAKESCQDCYDKKYIINKLISKNKEEASYFWHFRLDISMALLKYTPHKYDIAVTPSRVASLIKKIDETCQKDYTNLTTVWWGHIGDGNLHLNILKPVNISQKTFFKLCEELNNRVYSIVKTHGGTVSAEHGIGLLKKSFLIYTKDDKEINYMKKIKKIFDPNNIINKGKLI